MNTGGLRLEQAPPLSVPALFFALAPLALVAGGGLLAFTGLPPTPFHPSVMAATHLGTLGLLGSVMLGALYQMVPVVAGAPVPAARLAHLVQALWLAGVTGLVVGLASGAATSLWLGLIGLAAALLLFLVPMGWALGRAPGGGPPVWGMRLALIALALSGALGLWLAWGHATGVRPPNRLELLTAHVALATVGWLGGLIVAVSWVVVPMFYLTPSPSPWVTWTALGAMGLSVAAIPATMLAGAPPLFITLAAVPGLLTMWGLAPLALLRLIARRRRKRRDPSLAAWRLSLVAAPLALVASLAAMAFPSPTLLLLLGWLVLWAWAALLVHGMLSRIVPFLVWYHRFSALVGVRPVPPMRRLLPDRRVWVGLTLHGAMILLGALGLLLQADLLFRLAGGFMLATGLALAVELASVGWKSAVIARHQGLH